MIVFLIFHVSIVYYYYILYCYLLSGFVCFFFQAEDGIRGLVRSRGLGDVYKRQVRQAYYLVYYLAPAAVMALIFGLLLLAGREPADPCLLYTSDAADDLLCVDLGGSRIIKKKT